MNRPISILVCAAGFAFTSLATTGTAMGATPKDTGCPNGFQSQPLSYVLSQATPGFEGAINAADAKGNGDGTLCYKLLPDAIPLFQPTFLYEDNNITRKGNK